MYLLFCGTTDFILELKQYLKNVPHTLLEGTSSWQGLQLNAQVVVFFNKEDAVNTKNFLEVHCGQKDVPLHYITTQVTN